MASKLEEYVQCYKNLKRHCEDVKKNYEEVRAKKAGELTKDPRLATLIHKEKEKEIKQLKEETKKLKTHLQNYQQQSVDISKVKRERDIICEMVLDESSPKASESKESDLQTIKELELRIQEHLKTIKMLEEKFRKRETEFAVKVMENERYCDNLNKLKNKFVENSKNAETVKNDLEKIIGEQKKKMDGFEKQLQESKAEKETIENGKRKQIKALELQHEQTIDELKKSHTTELDNLKEEIKKNDKLENDSSTKESDKIKQEKQKLQNDLDYHQSELSKYKSMYQKFNEDNQKNMNSISNLTKEIDDWKSRYGLLNENSILLREKLHCTEKMLGMYIKVSVLESMTNVCLFR